MKQKVSHGQGSKVSSEWMLFSKRNFYLSFVMLWNRIQNYLQYQELRRVASMY